MRKLISLLRIVTIFLFLLIVQFVSVAQQDEQCVFGVQIDGDSSISFPFRNQFGLHHAVPRADGGFIVFSDNTGEMTTVQSISYRNGNSDAATSRNNGDGTFTTQTTTSGPTTTSSIDLRLSGSIIEVWLDEEYLLNVLDWYRARAGEEDEGDPSWATCDA